MKMSRQPITQQDPEIDSTQTSVDDLEMTEKVAVKNSQVTRKSKDANEQDGGRFYFTFGT